ncbi:MAG: alpha/beta hydrolase [Leptospirales bacterium]|nr:alpha/beta hydrolase [Leptospirales bacterium]
MTNSIPEFLGEKDLQLLLIHDLFSDQSAWNAQLEFFARHVNICNFPLSGHPGSPEWNQTATRSYLAENRNRLEQLVRTVDRLSIIAHGHSAKLALELASNFPDKVENLILLSPVLSPHALMSGLPRFLPFFYEMFFVFADTLGEKGPSLRRPFDRLGTLPAPAARKWVDDWRRQMPVDFGMIRARTLILAGDRLPRLPDPPVSEINENLPNSHLIRYAGLGHGLHIESPTTVNPVLLDFLLRPEGFFQKGLESFFGFIKGILSK